MADAWNRFRERVDWVAVGAIGLMALFLQPALHAAYRADDTWNSLIRGRLDLADEGLAHHLWASAEHFWSSGRPNGVGIVQGLLTAWVFDPHVAAYHAFIVVLTVAAGLLLYMLVRELGLSRGGALLVVALTVGAIQFRSYHDAVLGYSGAMPLIMIFLLASLLLYLRGLRRDDRRLLVVSLLLFLPCPLMYEGAYALVAIYPGIALLERRGWAAVRASAPFLLAGAAFVVLSLIGRATATSIAPGYEVGSSPSGMIKTFVTQLFTPLPGSNVFFNTDFASFLPLGGNATKAELLGGAWRGLAVFAIVLVVSLRLAGRDGSKLPPKHALWGLVTIGALLWLTAGLTVAVAPKYQFELVPGKGYLTALFQVFGWGLVASAALLALLRAASGRSVAAVRTVALCAAALLGIGAGVVGYNNLRVIALEGPIAKTRALLEHATSDGAFANLPRDSSLLFSPRDLKWQTGNWTQVPDGFEAMLLQRGDGKRLDGRMVEPTERFGCPRTNLFPPEDCSPLAPVAAWTRVRARPGGGSVIVAPFPTARDRVAAIAPARQIRVFVEEESGEPRPPQLVGRDAAAQPWRSKGLRWREVDGGDDWAIYEARVASGPLPLASSLDDIAGRTDFTASFTPDQIVRIFGTKRLLP